MFGISVFVAIVAFVILIGGIGLTAIDSTKSTVTVYEGYTIFKAEDDSIPPNPQDMGGEYYYVKGYWNDPQETIQDAYDFVGYLYDTSPKCTVHFTVQLRRRIYLEEGHVKKVYEPFEEMHVVLYRDNEKAIYANKMTDEEGVAIFYGVPVGVWDFHVINSEFEKWNVNPQSWTEEGYIYYKTVTFEREEWSIDGTVDATSTNPDDWLTGYVTEPDDEDDTTQEEPPPEEDEHIPDDDFTGEETGDEGAEEYEDLVNADTQTLGGEESPDHGEEWKAPWTKEGREQLTGAQPDYTTILVAIGFIGATGALLIAFMAGGKKFA